jgi:hypothetical protein
MGTISPLKQERLNRFWSRARVEALTEQRISQASLERWEAGKAWPRGDSIAVLCELFGKSPKELGLDKSNAIMGVKNVYAPQEGTPMSDLIRREIFCNLGSKLNSLVNTWPRRNYHYDELQREINKAIFDHQVLIQQDSIALFSRREALKSLALIPILLCTGFDGSIYLRSAKADTDTLLKHCAAGITACWYLRRGKELAFVSDLTSSYITLLQPLVCSHSEVHRKVAAGLLSQSFMLKSHLGNEGNIAFVEQAIQYSDLSLDSTTQALAYRRRANEHWQIKNYKDALLDAEKGYGLARSNKAIHPIIHSITAAGLSLCQAANGQTEEAKLSLKEARDLFDPTMPVPSMAYSESILTYVAARVKQHSALWQESVNLYEQSLNIPDISALGAIQNRINYAKTEISRDDQPRNMDLCVKLLTESITRAEELNSQRFKREAHEVYDLLKIAWPREDAIKKLGRDHFGIRK